MIIRDYEIAKALYQKQHFEGRNCRKERSRWVFPYGKCYIDEKFVEVEIPVDELISRVVDPHLIPAYIKIIKTQGSMGPAWVTLGKKMRNGEFQPRYENKFWVRDGNHRVESYKKMGLPKMPVIMPESHYFYYRKLKGL